MDIGQETPADQDFLGPNQVKPAMYRDIEDLSDGDLSQGRTELSRSGNFVMRLLEIIISFPILHPPPRKSGVGGRAPSPDVRGREGSKP